MGKDLAGDPQLLFDFDQAERRSIPELWHVDEIYREATAELLEKLYEDPRIERKSSGIHADDLAVYVSMWSNTGPDGGIIAIGVHDKGKIIGCEGKGEDLVKYETRARTDLVSGARVDSKRIQVRTASGETDFVHLIRVYFREDRVVENNKDDAYIRRGSSKHLLTEVEKRELQIERGQINFELESCNLLWPDDFDLSAVDAWVSNVYKIKNISKGSESNSQVLTRHHLGKMAKGSFVPNNACALLFAKDPQTVVPGCMLRFQRVDGIELKQGKDRNIIKNVEITGTVPGIISQSIELISSQLREYAQYDKDGKFFPVPEYPREAWQEAIVNACVHRSYSLQGSNIFVRMFDDRLVVESPGGFPALVNPKNIYETHFRRNWWLMDSIFYLQYVLCENEGVKRMRSVMLAMGLPEPIFEQKESNSTVVRVTLRNAWDMRRKWVDSDASRIVGAEKAKKLTDQERRIINFVAEHGQINVSQASLLSSQSRWHRAKICLENLCKMGILVQNSRFARDSKSSYVFTEILSERIEGEDIDPAVSI